MNLQKKDLNFILFDLLYYCCLLKTDKTLHIDAESHGQLHV